MLNFYLHMEAIKNHGTIKYRDHKTKILNSTTPQAVTVAPMLSSLPNEKAWESFSFSAATPLPRRSKSLSAFILKAAPLL
jgi:hypothetical protein